jgi:hypothetical protein
MRETDPQRAAALGDYSSKNIFKVFENSDEGGS